MHEAHGHHPPIAAPLPDVTTERLTLRRFEVADLDGLAAVFAKLEVWQFPFGRGFTRDETAGFIDRQRSHWETCGFGVWLAIELSSDRIVGYAGLSVPMFLPEILPAIEVGWRFDPDVWGRGYASEAARAALDHAFTTLGLTEVCSLPQTDNVASVAVAHRIGMRLDHVTTTAANGRFLSVDAAVFLIAADEWPAESAER